MKETPAVNFSFPCAPSKFKDRKVTVVGLGRFGGGLAAVEYLVGLGARVTVSDQATAEQLSEPLQKLSGLALENIQLGGHNEEAITGAELLVFNPAIPPENKWVQLARSEGIPLTTEIGLLWNELQQREIKIAAITGSNGKSTTAALLHSILKEHLLTTTESLTTMHSVAVHSNCWLGGNLGGSLLPRLSEMHSGDWAVLELSSFQLHLLEPLKIAPDIAVITNFTPNHLDWHGNLEHYRESKQHIARFQNRTQTLILNADDVDVSQWLYSGSPVYFSELDQSTKPLETNQLVSIHHRQLKIRDKKNMLPVQDWTSLKGTHHLANMAAAVSAALVAECDLNSIEAGIRNFQPLPHRLEYLGEIQGRQFYNDSLATTPESAIAALHAFDCPIHLLAGGADKGSDLSTFANEIVVRCKSVALMGETANKLQQLVESKLSTGTALQIQAATSFEQAFATTWKASEADEVILLSPGCASYGWFTNFKERGEKFCELFHGLKAETTSN